MRSLCGLLLVAPATVSAATLYSASINTPSGSEGISDSPTPVSFTQPPTSCAGNPSTCWLASASAGLSLAAAAQVRAESGGIPPPGYSVSGSANATASFSGYDVALSGPSGQSTATSLNLVFDGVSLAAASALGPIFSATLGIGTTLTGPNGAATDSGGLTVVPPAFETIGSGLLSGWSGRPLHLTTSSLLVNAGDVLTIGMSLGGEVSCSTNPFSGSSSCVAAFDVDAFSFTTTGPVFNLPAGWTANSVDGSIVDNRFVIPEPSTALLFWSGLVAMTLRQRRGMRGH